MTASRIRRRPMITSSRSIIDNPPRDAFSPRMMEHCRTAHRASRRPKSSGVSASESAPGRGIAHGPPWTCPKFFGPRPPRTAPSRRAHVTRSALSNAAKADWCRSAGPSGFTIGIDYDAGLGDIVVAADDWPFCQGKPSGYRAFGRRALPFPVPRRLWRHM